MVNMLNCSEMLIAW